MVKNTLGRKVGHINLSHPDKTVMAQSLSQLRQFLPEDYQSGVEWALENLK